MNDSIDTNSDLRDLIAVDFRELYDEVEPVTNDDFVA